MPLPSGDVKGSLIGVTEGAVGRTVHAYRHRVSLQDPASRRPNVDHGTGATHPIAGGTDNVSLGVQAHTVNATLGPPVVVPELVQRDILAQRAVIQDWVGPELPYTSRLAIGLDDVQATLVRRDKEAVGARCVEGHALAGPAAVRLRVRPQDILIDHLLLLAGIDVARVPRIAEPDSTPTVCGQVVGGIEPLSIQPVDDGRGTAIGFEADIGELGQLCRLVEGGGCVNADQDDVAFQLGRLFRRIA